MSNKALFSFILVLNVQVINWCIEQWTYWCLTDHIDNPHGFPNPFVLSCMLISGEKLSVESVWLWNSPYSLWSTYSNHLETNLSDTDTFFSDTDADMRGNFFQIQIKLWFFFRYSTDLFFKYRYAAIFFQIQINQYLYMYLYLQIRIWTQPWL